LVTEIYTKPFEQGAAAYRRDEGLAYLQLINICPCLNFAAYLPLRLSMQKRHQTLAYHFTVVGHKIRSELIDYLHRFLVVGTVQQLLWARSIQ